MNILLFIIALLAMLCCVWLAHKHRVAGQAVLLWRDNAIVAGAAALLTGLLALPVWQQSVLAPYLGWIGLILLLLALVLALLLGASSKAAVRKGLLLGGLIVALALVAGLFLWPAPPTEEGSAVMQELQNRTMIAREYAAEALTRDAGIAQESVTRSAYGFETSDPVIYIVAFAYPNGDGEATYGYRLTVDDAHHCTILSQGMDVGRQLLANWDTEGAEDAGDA